MLFFLGPLSPLGTPLTPGIPGTSGTPGTLGTPGTHGTPGNPGTPGTPATPGTLFHILTKCVDLAPARQRLTTSGTSPSSCPLLGSTLCCAPPRGIYCPIIRQGGGGE